MRARKPNLLFVFSDQHRWCDMGAYGNSEVQTPNFDAFADRAVRFENCISNSPLCVPARGSMLTGLMPIRHRAVTNDLPIDPEAESVARVMERNGYHTGYVGKWHLRGVPRRSPVVREHRLGFDEWNVCNSSHRYMKAFYYDADNEKVEIDGYEPIAQTDLAIDFVERNRDRPWGLVLSWGPPHDPYHQVPDTYLDMYDPDRITLRSNVPERIRVYQRKNTPLMFRLLYRLLFRTGPTTDRAKIRQDLQGYYAHITALDEQFGRLLESLRRTGQLENTIVVYTSDHGDMLGSQGFTNKQLPYEESIRVPLLVSYEGVTKATTTDELVGLVDLPVSLMGLMGMRFTTDVDGQDLHELFVSEGARGRGECYISDLVPAHAAAFRGSTSWRGVRTREYTFSRTPFDEGTMLYDNLRDLQQQRNLIGNPAYAEVQDRLLRLTNAYAEKHDGVMPFDDLLRKYDLVDEWNRSQKTMRLPTIPVQHA